jgi:hypothetical protein
MPIIWSYSILCGGSGCETAIFTKQLAVDYAYQRRSVVLLDKIALALTGQD